VKNVYPHDLDLQFARMNVRFSTRSALHTYKEMLIPLYYLETGKIESNVIGVINEHDAFGYEELSKCGKKYKTRDGSITIDEDNVRSELEELYKRLGTKLEQETEYEPSGKLTKGPPIPADQVPNR